MGLQQPTKSPGHFLLAIGLILVFIPAVLAASDNISRISIQDLKAKMDTSEQMIILDVRSGADYASSMYKIKGAVRIPVDQIKDRYRELPAGVEIVTY